MSHKGFYTGFCQHLVMGEAFLGNVLWCKGGDVFSVSNISNKNFIGYQQPQQSRPKYRGTYRNVILLTMKKTLCWTCWLDCQIRKKK